ncbi:cell division protein ZapE [Tranquillimonas rosea]|uniref:Cell division protein ZapE n=1 Tax=Tranquillimonas rosea TaxID=641238 RepID=A0A1H9W3A6_9RHOB|nr:cell division protein ZapE [Tranquillimonas rosea]SES28402.1 cell division protein ZapE [Tranquillimonas rosea]
MTKDMATLYDETVRARGLTADPAQRAVLPEFDRIAAALAEGPARKGGLRGLFSRPADPPKGLYLWGGVGRGKSMLMDLFYEAAEIDAKRRVHFHAFMQEVHRGMKAARARGVDDAIAPFAREVAAEVRLLCFDEMQIGDVADAMIVGRLFEKLFDAGVVVVTTSNRPPDDLYKDGLNRSVFLPFIRLLKHRLAVRELDAAQDYRQDRPSAGESYFTPADAEASARMDRVWDDLAEGTPEPLELTVSGRTVTVPRHAGGVARARFWDLCGRPLGAADYLAVAEAVDVLLLEEVPRLGSENYNEARRFVTLIDALYEAGTRLYISAADTPESLYVEGEGTFEFERTASRLREMQSEGWGG